MIETLLRLGLSEKEAKVYLACLELAEDTVQNIAEKAQVNRATTYVILEKLMQLGLVSSIERGKKTVFIAENPAELVNIIERRQQELEAHKKGLEEAMSRLQAIYNGAKDKPIVRYFEGPEGLEALDRYGIETLYAGKEMIGIMPFDVIEEHFPARRKKSLNERVSKGLKSHIIYTHKGGEIPEEVNKAQLRDALYLSREDFPIDATITVYPDWGVKFYNFEEGNYFGVLFQSASMARNMELLMKLAWKGAQQQRAEKKG